MITRAMLAATLLLAAVAQAEAAEPSPPKPGVPAVQRPYAELTPSAKLALGQTADWVEPTADAVWIGTSGPNAVVKIDPQTNTIAARVRLPGEPCAGLAAGFGRLWVPLCAPHGGRNSLAEVDLKSARLIRVLPIGPAAEEGGVAVGGDSVWLVVDKTGGLARIDPRSGRMRQTIRLRPGCYNPIAASGVIWVSCIEADRAMAVDARSGKVLGEFATGPRPRFLTAGFGSIWVLNQGDGSVTRIDAVARKATASIALGVPGHGGDIAFGAGEAWVSVMGVPLSAIDPAADAVRRQWVGPGGDALRFGFGALWITDYHAGTVARIPLAATRASP
jgi:DNA-binding beta-propeller fold protein YncE